VIVRARRWQWLAVLFAAATASLALWHGIDGWPTAATHLRDDAYYEFVWAHNLANGNGPIVSDRQWTSGVQLLWSLLLSLCSKFTAEVPHVAVVLGGLCHLLGATSWWWSGRRTRTAVVAALCWLGNPLLLRECQNGQETALACLLGAWLWQRRRAQPRRFLAIAALAGLARADLLALAGLLAVARPREALGLRLALALLPLLPWVAFNQLCGGSWLPDSAAPMAWLAHANFERLLPTASELLQQYWWYARPALLGAPFATAGLIGFGVLVGAAVQPWWPAAVRFVPLLAVVIAAIAGRSDLGVPLVAAVFLALAPRRSTVRLSRSHLALLLALVGIVALHWSVRWYPRDYYAAPLAIGAAVGWLHLRRWPRLLAIATLAAGVAVVSAPLPRESLRSQVAMQVAGELLQPLLGAQARVGCFNSGLLTWAQLRHRGVGPVVVNLDGVVDSRTFAALQDGDLAGFLDRERVDFLVDHEVQWSLDPRLPHASGAWFARGEDPGPGLEVLVRCVAPDTGTDRSGTASFALCWRRGRGTRPVLPDTATWLCETADGDRILLWPAAAGERLVRATSPDNGIWFEAAVGGHYAMAIGRDAAAVTGIWRAGVTLPLPLPPPLDRR
jgi:hypothetical protein